MFSDYGFFVLFNWVRFLGVWSLFWFRWCQDSFSLLIRLAYGCFYSILYEDGYLPLLWIGLRIVFSIFVCFRCFNSYLVLKCTVVNTSTCISIYGWYFKCSVSSSQTNLASSVVLLGFYMCVSGRLSINSARLSFKFMIHFGWLSICSSHYRG
jgi:hypothetical protein